MSALGSTIPMLRVLPDEAVQVVFDITRAMLENKPSSFVPFNRDNLLRDIDLSTEQFARGKTRGAGEVI